MTTVQIFHKMFDYLVANKLISNQTELARTAGLNEVSVSRILNGQVKSVKQETLWKVNTAFGNIFSPEWMRGQSEVMLQKDLAPVSASESSPTPTDLAAALLAAKDETIAALRSQLSDKDRLIAALQQHINDLRLQTAMEKGLQLAGHSQSAAAEHHGAAAYDGK